MADVRRSKFIVNDQVKEPGGKDTGSVSEVVRSNEGMVTYKVKFGSGVRVLREEQMEAVKAPAGKAQPANPAGALGDGPADRHGRTPDDPALAPPGTKP